MPSVRPCSTILLLLLAGCTHWEPVPVPMVSASALPSSLRVWSSGRDATVLERPFVRGDTLYGRSRGDTLGIALPTIALAARPRVDAVRTAGVVVGGVASWIALGLLGGGWE